MCFLRGTEASFGADLGAERFVDIKCRKSGLPPDALRNVREVYGIPCVVALNRFPADTDTEVARVVELVEDLGVRTHPASHFVDGGAGATDLAKGVLDLLESSGPTMFSFTYPDGLPLKPHRPPLGSTCSTTGPSWACPDPAPDHEDLRRTSMVDHPPLRIV